MTNPLKTYQKQRRSDRRKKLIAEATDIVQQVTKDLGNLQTQRMQALKAGNGEEVSFYNNLVREAMRTQTYVLKTIHDDIEELK